MPKQKKCDIEPHKTALKDTDGTSVLDDLHAQMEALEHQKAELEQRVYQLRLENDILEKAAEIIKKTWSSVC